MAVILKSTGSMSVMLCYDKHKADLSHGVGTRETATPSPGVSLTEKAKNRVESKNHT